MQPNYYPFTQTPGDVDVYLKIKMFQEQKKNAYNGKTW